MARSNRLDTCQDCSGPLMKQLKEDRGVEEALYMQVECTDCEWTAIEEWLFHDTFGMD